MTKIERDPTIQKAEAATEKTVIKEYDKKESLPMNDKWLHPAHDTYDIYRYGY